MPLFIALRKIECRTLPFFKKEVKGPRHGGLFLTPLLCKGLWADALSVSDDCYKQESLSGHYFEQLFPQTGVSQGIWAQNSGFGEVFFLEVIFQNYRNVWAPWFVISKAFLFRAKYSFNNFVSCFYQQLQQSSSNSGPPSRLSHHWLTLASQTHGCTIPGPFLTPLTPPALASVASVCQPPPDTTLTCHPRTQTTKARTSSPTPTCITARAQGPTSFPWWHQETQGVSAPPPACCPALELAPGGPTVWWTRAWTPRVRV